MLRLAIVPTPKGIIAVSPPTTSIFSNGTPSASAAICGLVEPLRWSARQAPEMGVPPGFPTLPVLLRGAGYRTALIGKWHLGYLPRYSPLKSGYDEFFGVMGGYTGYYTHIGDGGEHDLYEGEAPIERAGYVTDLLSERALASSAVRLRSPLRITPDGLLSRLFLQRSPLSLLTTAACSGLTPAPDRRRSERHSNYRYFCEHCCSRADSMSADHSFVVRAFFCNYQLAMVIVRRGPQ